MPDQFEPESDPESGDEESSSRTSPKHGSYKTFLNGNLLLLLLLFYSILFCYYVRILISCFLKMLFYNDFDILDAIKWPEF